MQITGLKIRAVNIPLLKPYTVSLLGKVTTTRSVIVEVFTDQGLVGIGETDPDLMFTGESQQTVMTMLASHLGPAVLGIDPLDLENLHVRMNAVCVGNHFAKAALDLACHDIWGKYHRAPLCRLFGGMVHARIEVMWSLGSDTAEANVADAVARVEEGYRTIGLKVGTLSPDEDVRRVAEVRKAVGADIKIRCDANLAWSPNVAVATIRKLQGYDICMIEQPVRGWDIEGLAQVRAGVEVPIAVDEGFFSPRDAIKLAKVGAADIFSLKTTELGGLLPSRKAVAVIEAAGHQVFFNSMIELGVSVMSGLNCAVSTPNLSAVGHALNSVRRLRDDILKTPVAYEGNYIVAPTGRVGLGVELDEVKMKKYSIGEVLIP